MPKSRPPYPAEFRQQIIELVRAGRTPEELETQCAPRAQTIRNWVSQADRDSGKRQEGLTRAERDELSRLRRENRQLQWERESLAKAAAGFARETGAIPDTGSSACVRIRPCLPWRCWAGCWASPRAASRRGASVRWRRGGRPMSHC